MKMSLVLSAAVALVSLASSANAEQLLFTQSSAKSGSSVAIDYVSDGQSVGVQLEILIPGKAQLDLSDFAKELPKGYVLEQNVVDGKLIATIVNDDRQPMPAGIISFGSIKSVGGTGSFVLERLESVDANGQILSVETVQ
jgi:hypothetical protein